MALAVDRLAQRGAQALDVARAHLAHALPAREAAGGGGHHRHAGRERAQRARGACSTCAGSTTTRAPSSQSPRGSRAASSAMPRQSEASADGEPSTRRRHPLPRNAAASSRAPLRARALAGSTTSGAPSSGVRFARGDMPGSTHSSRSSVACGAAVAIASATAACGVTTVAARANAWASARTNDGAARKSRNVVSSGQRAAAASRRASISAIGSAPASTVNARPSSAPRRCRCGSSAWSTTSCVCSGRSRAAKARASQRCASITPACRRPPSWRAHRRRHDAPRTLASQDRCTEASPPRQSLIGRQKASRTGARCMRSASGCRASR